MKIKNILISAVILVFFITGNAAAHKVIIFAWVEDGYIHTESSFGAKRKAKACAITVFDEKDQVVHKGQTDENGNYSFKIPENIDSDLILKLDAGTGHQAQWKIAKNELITPASTRDVQTAIKEGKKLEENPSILKIISGIVIIFLLAFGIKFLKQKIS